MLKKDDQLYELYICFEYNGQLHVLENEQDICEPMIFFFIKISFILETL